MKKQLKDDLVALAEKIALLKQEDRVSTGELKELAKSLYEKLTILHFTESNMFTAGERRQQELVKTAVKVEAAPRKQEPEPEVRQEEQASQEFDEYNPSGLEYNPDDSLAEPNTEKIKDIVAQMPPETQKIDDLFSQVTSSSFRKNDMNDIGGVHYDNLPQFEPAVKSREIQPQRYSDLQRHTESRQDNHSDKQADKPRSLNDRLKKGINIGVNDRHAFVRHLFEGSTSDYNRVLSQLNTLKTKEEAFNFVANMVKPDYNNWEGKEEYETRFLSIIEKKFE